MRKIIAGLLVAAAITTTSAGARQHDTPDAQLAKLIAGRVPGEATDCISLFNSPSSQIVDGKAIVYRIGGTLYVNEPRSGADALRSDDILVTRTFGSQLCSIDSVRLVDRASRFPHGFVILGSFVPYRKPKPLG